MANMEFVLGNIFVRPNFLHKAGDKVDGHTHNFDHVTYVVRGRLKIERTKPNGDKRIIEISATDNYPFGLIVAEDSHELTALVDDTVFHCVYAHRDPQGNVVQSYTGWLDAYL